MDGFAYRQPNRTKKRQLATVQPPRRRAQRMLVAGLFALLPAHPGAAGLVCKPLLAITTVAAERPTDPLANYRWTGTVAADARFCATTSGPFEVDFIRIKEYAPDIQFIERYRWREGLFQVSIELAVDEAILDYRIGFVAPCVCRAPHDM